MATATQWDQVGAKWDAGRAWDVTTVTAILAGSMVATAILGSGIGFTVPNFPAHRRLAFYWPQPIGPTHVRVF